MKSFLKKLSAIAIAFAVSVGAFGLGGDTAYAGDRGKISFAKKQVTMKSLNTPFRIELKGTQEGDQNRLEIAEDIGFDYLSDVSWVDYRTIQVTARKPGVTWISIHGDGGYVDSEIITIDVKTPVTKYYNKLRNYAKKRQGLADLQDSKKGVITLGYVEDSVYSSKSHVDFTYYADRKELGSGDYMIFDINKYELEKTIWVRIVYKNKYYELLTTGFDPAKYKKGDSLKYDYNAVTDEKFSNKAVAARADKLIAKALPQINAALRKKTKVSLKNIGFKRL